MASGVTIYLPETVVIDPEVTAGPDTVIEPGAQLLGQNAHRRALQNRHGKHSAGRSRRRRCRVGAHSILDSSRVGATAQVGPFARLRPGADIRPGAHVGNFVEVKNTVLHEGAKAMHLSIWATRRSGRDANIGAGTITCNYDGVAKHPTTIGSRVFIGSDTALVAPVRVGDGAYVAAGSIITENVPADALAIARGRQVNKPGWAAKRRTEMKRAANAKPSRPKRRKAKSRSRSKPRRIVRRAARHAIRRPRAKSRRR